MQTPYIRAERGSHCSRVFAIPPLTLLFVFKEVSPLRPVAHDALGVAGGEGDAGEVAAALLL
tara:strand:- start:371 stop:556 length:186 start_codon:yes stop_codon:yes gene_type:complete